MTLFRDRSIKQKLTLIILLASSVVLLLACAAFVEQFHPALRRGRQAALGQLAPRATPGGPRPLEQRHEFVTAVLNEPDLVAAARRAGPRQFREGLERVGLGLPPLESGTREQLEQREARFSGFPHHASARGRRPVTRTSSRPSAVVSRTSR